MKPDRINEGGASADPRNAMDPVPKPSSKLVGRIREILIANGADPEEMNELKRDVTSAVAIYCLEKRSVGPSRYALRKELKACNREATMLRESLANLSPQASNIIALVAERGIFPDEVLERIEALCQVLEIAQADRRLFDGGRWKDLATRRLVGILLFVFRRYTGSTPKRHVKKSTKCRGQEVGGPLHEMVEAVLTEIDPGRLTNRKTGVDGIIHLVLKGEKK